MPDLYDSIALTGAVGPGFANAPEDLARLGGAIEARTGASPFTNLPGDGTAEDAGIAPGYTGAIQASQIKTGNDPDGVVLTDGPTLQALNQGGSFAPPPKIKATIGSRGPNRPEDLAKGQSKLARVGYAPRVVDPAAPGNRHVDEATVVRGTRAFQRANGLPADGAMNPNGPTERTLDAQIGRQQKALEAALDETTRDNMLRAHGGDLSAKGVTDLAGARALAGWQVGGALKRDQMHRLESVRPGPNELQSRDPSSSTKSIDEARVQLAANHNRHVEKTGKPDRRSAKPSTPNIDADVRKLWSSVRRSNVADKLARDDKGRVLIGGEPLDPTTYELLQLALRATPANRRLVLQVIPHNPIDTTSKVALIKITNLAARSADRLDTRSFNYLKRMIQYLTIPEQKFRVHRDESIREALLGALGGQIRVRRFGRGLIAKLGRRALRWKFVDKHYTQGQLLRNFLRFANPSKPIRPIEIWRDHYIKATGLTRKAMNFAYSRIAGKAGELHLADILKRSGTRIVDPPDGRKQITIYRDGKQRRPDFVIKAPMGSWLNLFLRPSSPAGQIVYLELKVQSATRGWKQKAFDSETNRGNAATLDGTGEKVERAYALSEDFHKIPATQIRKAAEEVLKTLPKQTRDRMIHDLMKFHGRPKPDRHVPLGLVLLGLTRSLYEEETPAK